MLTEKELLAQPSSEYMSDDQLAFFQSILVNKMKSINERIRDSKSSLQVERNSDVSDTASVEESRTLGLNIAQRDNQELARINKALTMIAEGEYGYCLDSGEEIGLKRLIAVPESLFSVESMRAIEAKQQHQRSGGMGSSF